MKNVLPFILCAALLAVAIIVGIRVSAPESSAQPVVSRLAATNPAATDNVPCLGSIQILNGCGISGAANKVSDYLRSKRFDVKNIGNAPTGNYKETLVVSRKKDCAMAKQVAAALNNAQWTLLRNGDELYDVTVFIGSDFSERIK